MFPDQVPAVFSGVFLLAFSFPVLMVALLAKKSQIRHGFWKVLAFYLVYLALVAKASLAGFFDEIMFPPKIVLCTTLPLAISFALLFITEPCKRANSVLSLHDLVSVHIFRLIGSTFIILYFYDLLPPLFALVAGIGDVLTAIASIFVAKAVKNRTSNHRKLVYIWNTFGLVDIVATSAMAIIFTKISIDQGTMGVEFLAEFPFCFIPAFAPPTIIFLHLLVFRKLSTQKK